MVVRGAPKIATPTLLASAELPSALTPRKLPSMFTPSTRYDDDARAY